MDTTNLSLQEANAHRKNRAYQSAIDIFQPLYQQNPSQFDEWDGWSYAYCLKEIRQYQTALELCRQLYGRFSASAFIRQLYASCIYYTQFGNKNLPPLPVLKKAVQAMVDLYPPHQEYSLAAKAILKLVKAMATLQTIPWKEMESWLLRLEPDLLDPKPFSIKMPDGKTKEFASSQEEWYSWMLRVKGGMNKPDELLELLQSARSRGIKWHYQNDIWFARKEAFALHQLGKKKEAEHILRKLILRKRDWFLLSDLAEVVDNKEEALQLMARAALAPGPTAMKVKLFQNMYRLLKENPEDVAMAKMHLVLIALARMEQGWPVPPTLDAEIEKTNTDLSAVNSAKEAIKILIPFWRKLSESNSEIHSGKIKLIHTNGFSGIVKASDGKEYYFNMHDAQALKQKAVAGTPVNFELVDGFNKKKNMATRNAVRLTLKS